MFNNLANARTYFFPGMQHVIMINFIIESALFGFSLFSLFFAFWYFLQGDHINPLWQALNRSAIITFRLAGIAFIISWCLSVYKGLYAPTLEEEKLLQLSRMFGPYWMEYWITPATYITCTQLFWIRTVRRTLLIRVVFAIIMLLVLSIDSIFTLINSLHHHFLPIGWNQYPITDHILLNWLFELVIFAALVTTVQLVYPTGRSKAYI